MVGIRKGACDSFAVPTSMAAEFETMRFFLREGSAPDRASLHVRSGFRLVSRHLTVTPPHSSAK